MPYDPERLNLDKFIFERRRFVRVSGNFVVSYTDVTTQETKSDITQTKNISLGGILFTTDREFPLGTILKIKLRLPDSREYINLKVKVVGSKERMKDVLYETRVKFIGIKDEDKDCIRRIVEYQLKKQGEH